MPSQSDIEHLLRRTEYVARDARVAELQGPATREQCVDDILSTLADPGTCLFVQTQNWQQGTELVHYWLDRMAHDSPRPIQEKMSFFWHGHFVSSMDKVGSAELMREQIDLYRHGGLGNLRHIAITMATQVAMLRYLDNNENKKASPNKNFARELMELFMLGVGNYTEADVEAATAAWTGHGDDWETDTYVWRIGRHDSSVKSYLGQTINNGGDPTKHGEETIHVMLGAGVVPADASVVANRGRPTRDVCAEFVSKKLWAEFAGTPIPPDVLTALRQVALANDFAIKPWLKALLMRDEFYTTAVKQGRVRTPVEFMVSLLVATGLRSADATPLWLMEGMGQAPLYPPNVSGWKHNSYWISASAFGQRVSAARQIMWCTMRDYWNENDLGVIRLGGGSISKLQIEGTSPWHQPSDTAQAAANVAARREILTLMANYMQLDLSPTSRQSLDALATDSEWWELNDLVGLLFLTPEMQVA